MTEIPIYMRDKPLYVYEVGAEGKHNLAFAEEWRDSGGTTQLFSIDLDAALTLRDALNEFIFRESLKRYGYGLS